MGLGKMSLYAYNGRVTDFMLNQTYHQELAESIKVLILIAGYADMSYDLEAALRVHFKLLSQHDVPSPASPPREFRAPVPTPSSSERGANSPSASGSCQPF